MSDKQTSLESFLAMTESTDYGVAMEYLEKNDWDLTKAVDEYINTHKFKNEGNNSTPPQNQPASHASGVGNDMNIPNMPPGMPNPGFDMGGMNMPDPNPQPQNQPESLLGGAMGAFQQFANNFGNSVRSGFSSGIPTGMGGRTNNQNIDVVMDEENKSSGRIFLEKFREKNGTGIELPPFVDGDFDEIIKESKRLRRPIFLYVHDHKGDSCTIVDQTVIGEEVVKDLISKFICVGVNIHSEQGQELVEEYNVPGAPYVAVMYFDENGVMQNIGSRQAEEINVNSVFEMCDTAYDMMSTLFDPKQGVTDFNVADSHLNIAETLTVKAEIEDQLKNKKATGFVETRRREPEIDPDTGMPAGMTEKQIQDKILKDTQKEELEAAMEADRIKLEKMKEKAEEVKQQQLEEVKKQEQQEQAAKYKKLKAEELKKKLPEEPSEDNPDACTVQFRLPDGSESIQRRFLKSDKVQTLYDYIHSLAADEEFEGYTGEFDIIQNFPKKVFDDMESTLEKEGLHPRSKLYIKEHSHA